MDLQTPVRVCFLYCLMGEGGSKLVIFIVL